MFKILIIPHKLTFFSNQLLRPQYFKKSRIFQRRDPFSKLRKKIGSLTLYSTYSFDSYFKCASVLNNGSNNERQFGMKSRKVLLQGLIDVILPCTAPHVPSTPLLIQKAQWKSVKFFHNLKFLRHITKVLNFSPFLYMQMVSILTLSINHFIFTKIRQES